MNALGALYWRELLRFARQRSRWMGALMTPLVFWFLVGTGLGDSFRGPGADSGTGYFEFFFPGALALSVLFTAIFSTISVIEDRHQGFLQGVLVSPVSRATIIASKVLSGATLGLVQGLLLLAVARISGVDVSGASLMVIVLLLFAMGAALTALGFVFAWRLGSAPGHHGRQDPQRHENHVHGSHADVDLVGSGVSA